MKYDWLFSNTYFSILHAKSIFPLMTTDNFCDCGIPLEQADGTCKRCKKGIPAHRRGKVSSATEQAGPGNALAQGKTSVSVAINSARIVNGYGLFIQIVGSLLAGLILIFGLSQPGVYPKDSTVMIVSVVVSIGLVLGYLVLGAFFRMISNYVIARLEK